LRHTIAWSLSGLASVALRCGSRDEALALLGEAILLAEKLGQRTRVAACLIGLAGAALLTGLPERGAQLLGAANALCEQLGSPLDPADQIDCDSAAITARAMLGEDAYESEYALGQTLSREQLTSELLGTVRLA
jgi:hypothetical protein